LREYKTAEKTTGMSWPQRSFREAAENPYHLSVEYAQWQKEFFNKSQISNRTNTATPLRFQSKEEEKIGFQSGPWRILTFGNP
jgi:hypothetical protein